MSVSGYGAMRTEITIFGEELDELDTILRSFQRPPPTRF